MKLIEYSVTMHILPQHQIHSAQCPPLWTNNITDVVYTYRYIHVHAHYPKLKYHPCTPHIHTCTPSELGYITLTL